MTDAAISVRSLSKRYRIDHERDPYGRLSESIVGVVRQPIDRLRGRRRTSSEWFWALRDVTFDIAAGEAVGVIGRNGAGKSTLLKILSRVTAPTTGTAALRGRVGSLLEVGTGFHPELTGRENVFLSGAVLGMRRAEIARKFDEIVSFAGVEQFLDTAVKRYSSGMQVRLGFAVAAHLESEILLVDEVLAVGDADFQRKCLGKMAEIGQQGRTVLFVSHSMSSVLRLCDRAVLLDSGTVRATGPSHDVVRAYLEVDNGAPGIREWADLHDAPGDDVARLRSIKVVPSSRSSSTEEIDIREAIDIEVEYLALAIPEAKLHVNFQLFNDEGLLLFTSSDWNDKTWWERPRQPGLVRATCRIPGNFLSEGRFTITVGVMTSNPTHLHAVERDAVTFVVVDRTDGDGVRGVHATAWPGVLRPMLEWHVETEARPFSAVRDP